MNTRFPILLLAATLGACATAPRDEAAGLLSYDALGAEITITVTAEPQVDAVLPDEVVAAAGR